MAESSIVAVAFRDLEDAYQELSSESTSPIAVRRSFARFVDLSQKLTSYMRKEYSAKNGEKWNASGYRGWDDVTDLFKQLRNDDQHDRPVAIVVEETQYIRVFEEGPLIAFSGTWSFSLDDQIADTPRNDVQIGFVDPKTGRPSGKIITPTRTEHEFHLSPSSPEAEALLTKVSDTNVRTLSERCFQILTGYYRYYQQRLTTSEE